MACALGQVPALAGTGSCADQKKWEDQKTWADYSEREQRKTADAQAKAQTKPKQETLLDPILSTKNQPAPVGQSYVVMPGSDPPPQVPQVQVETTYVPTRVNQDPLWLPAYGWGSAWGPGWGWGHRSGWGWGGPWYGGWGGFYGGPSAVTMRPVKRITQTGPSKASGNYYSPSTPDPTASGSYYATPSGLPKAAPIIQTEPAKDYWGKNGNPLPDDMQQ
jgi:hypothetical protein